MNELSLRGKRVELLHSTHPANLLQLLLSLRGFGEDFLWKNSLNDPNLIPDMTQAVARIFAARERGERVMIFGDYDVDGISSTAALFLFLHDDLGIDVSYRLPHRVHDGYGIKKYHMEEIAKTGTALIITVDCGTKDLVPIEYARQLGMDVIVTDHHTCPDILPECIAVVNPKRRDSLYPFWGLSWSGVVWKLIHALSDIFFPERTHEMLQKYVDIVSLWTVADCMPMLDENRTIVRQWILQSQKSHHPFFQTFVDTIKRPILTEEDIGFFVGPLLNAGGRITTPYQSLSALLAGSLDSFSRIQELISVNEIRKWKSRDAHERALEIVDTSQPFLVFIEQELEHGILWLVAAKLTETYNKPSAVFTFHEWAYVWSLRAPPGIDLVKILDASHVYLTRYGGHAGAAGCTIDALNIAEACQAFIRATEELYSLHDSTPLLRVDTVLDRDKVSLQTLHDIETLRPFGNWFPPPIFMLQNICSPINPLGQTGEHIRWDFPGKLEIIGFRMANYVSELNNKKVHLIGTLKSHIWGDAITPQFQVVDVVI